MKVKKFQMGGAAPEAGPAQGGGQPGPEEQLAGMAQQIIEQLGPEAAAMLAQIIVQMLQGATGGGEPQEKPVYARKGGKLVLIGK